MQIAWHGSEPVLSLDFHPHSGLLATAGADHDIKIWSVHQKESGSPTVEFEADLCYHSKAVNVLRFSPSGQLLASGGDGGEILIWKPIERADKKPSWKVLKTLQLHVRDVLDLAWSPDSLSLMSGSVDNQCMIWDVVSGKVLQVLNDHQHFVQGVAWDPAGEFLTSISSDRTCRIYSRQSVPKSKKRKLAVVQNMFTCKQVLAKSDALPSKTNITIDADGRVAKASQLFHDETLPSFFRRLAWSPDSSFLVVPSGLHRIAHEAPSCNVSFIFSRSDLSRPCIHLPAPTKPVVAVRFCPVIFSLRENETEKGSSSGFALPYRLVFAVATLDSLYVYDTQRSEPIVIFAGIHYAAITDIAWSADAQYVAVSSQDGYCSLLIFHGNELGTKLSSGDVPANIAKFLPENLLGKPQESLPNSTELSQVSEPVGLMNEEQSSPIVICPRPLKHRRITPTALPATCSPIVQKQIADQTSITVSDKKLQRITPIALTEDGPSSSGNCLDTETVHTPSSTQNSLSAVQAADAAETPDSSTCEASSPGAKKRLRINPIPILAGEGALNSGGNVIPRRRPTDCDQSASIAKFRSLESCLQEQGVAGPATVSTE